MEVLAVHSENIADDAHDDLYGNISRLLLKWLSWNVYLGQRESNWASTGGCFNNLFGKFYFSSIVLFFSELITEPNGIPNSK